MMLIATKSLIRPTILFFNVGRLVITTSSTIYLSELSKQAIKAHFVNILREKFSPGPGFDPGLQLYALAL